MQTHSSADPYAAIMTLNQRPERAMVRGTGSWLFDEADNAYLDLIQGWAVNCLGHAPEVLNRALLEQAQQLWNPSPAFHNPRQRQLARLLTEQCGLDRVNFCNTGAEANEAAIKLARKWGALHKGGATTIVTTHGSFHGRTLATMAASGKPGFANRFAPRAEGFVHVPFDDLDNAATALKDSGAVAFMVEPVQGEAGVVVPGPQYLAGLRALCDECDCLLIFDEVQTGMGRTGPLFAHQAANVTPDIMTLGKGLGGGAPLAAMMAREAVSCFESGDQGGTFNGNPLMCAVGCAVVEAITSSALQQHAAARAQQLSEGLDAFVHAGLATSSRGTGLLQALELPAPLAARTQQACYREGLLLNAPQPSTLRFMPALNIPKDDLTRALEILRLVLDEQRASGTAGR